VKRRETRCLVISQCHVCEDIVSYGGWAQDLVPTCTTHNIRIERSGPIRGNIEMNSPISHSVALVPFKDGVICVNIGAINPSLESKARSRPDVQARARRDHDIIVGIVEPEGLADFSGGEP